MATQRQATKKGKGAGFTPAPAYDIEQPNPLALDECQRLLGEVHAEMTDHGRESPTVALLLLLHYLAFEEDDQKRFAVWHRARAMFALDMTEPYYALEKQLGAELAELRKGANG